jgi:DNA polymerase III subunit epsilon
VIMQSARRARSAPPLMDPAVRLTNLSYAVVDVETTGGSPLRGHRITEVAAVIVRGGCVVDCFEALVNPERSIPPLITRLTHITQAMVRDQPTFREIAPRLVEILEGHVFVAHNAAFDRRFVGIEVFQAGGRWTAPGILCTVRMARRLLPHLRRRSLDQVAHHYGIRIEGRHRAMGDAMATAKCLIRLLDDAGTRGLDNWGELHQVLQAGTGAARRRRRSALPQIGLWELGA